MFPQAYSHDAFVAQHGSWNRSVPVGYRVMRVRFDEAGDPAGKEVFADGWLRPDGTVLGRPVDVQELPDGSIVRPCVCMRPNSLVASQARRSSISSRSFFGGVSGSAVADASALGAIRVPPMSAGSDSTCEIS